MASRVRNQTAEAWKERADEARGVCRTRAERVACGFPRRFTMAFQPLVDVSRGEVFAHEALVRGPAGESAGTMFGCVRPENLHAFDECCRVTALETATRIGVESAISINFMPNALDRSGDCLRTTLRAARRLGIAFDRLIFEVTEVEKVPDIGALAHILAEYRRFGFRTAIDDFGAGFAGLALLADMQPDILKIDIALIRGIDRDRVRRSIVEGICGTARKLGVTLVAEGIETEAERDTLLDLGIPLQQGFLFARPVIEGWVANDALRGLPAGAGSH